MYYKNSVIIFNIWLAGISFTPREIGQHIVSVKRMGQHIVNSPFKITVGEREVGDAKKVKVTGNGLKDGKTHVENVFTVDTRSAGESLIVFDNLFQLVITQICSLFLLL